MTLSIEEKKYFIALKALWGFFNLQTKKSQKMVLALTSGFNHIVMLGENLSIELVFFNVILVPKSLLGTFFVKICFYKDSECFMLS